MSGTARTIVTVFASIAIAAAIIFLEMHRVGPAQIPSGSADVTLASTTPASVRMSVEEKKKLYDVAKEITDPTGFINTDAFTIQSLVGKKVILVDFWTYSCINCIRTLPYVEAWYEKYKDAGLVVVGVHTPEFDFEKVLANVRSAVSKFGITYPVVLDSNYGTWGAYQNQYWPHEYLIDIDGFIAEDHIGEGGYDATEATIQKLLAERNASLGLSTPIPGGTVSPRAESLTTSMPLSPETYFGSARSENKFVLGGTWKTNPQYIESGDAGATISYGYQAQNVYFVSAAPGGAVVEVRIDGKNIPASMRGGDVDQNGLLHVGANRLYTLVKGSAWGTHNIELILKSGTLQAFTFTFG